MGLWDRYPFVAGEGIGVLDCACGNVDSVEKPGGAPWSAIGDPVFPGKFSFGDFLGRNGDFVDIEDVAFFFFHEEYGEVFILCRDKILTRLCAREVGFEERYIVYIHI